jgi:hypothetical protein
MTDLIKNKSVFYDLQEPTSDDLNYIGEAVEEQIRVRGIDFYTNGVLDLDKFVIVPTGDDDTVTFSVGPGVAYIDGRRVEIPEGENKDYNLANPCKDLSNGECPSSTGNINISVSVNENPVVTVFLLYAKDYDPNSYDINPETYAKRYTKERAGYAIAWAVGSNPNNRPNAPFYPSQWTNYLESSNNPNWTIGNGKDGRSYIILADLIWDGTKWTVDKSRCQKVTLKEEIQPLGETEVHQTAFHASGVSKLTESTFNYYKYAIKDDFGTFYTNTSPLIKNINPGIDTKVAFIRVAITNTGNNPSLIIKINNDDSLAAIVPSEKIPRNSDVPHTVTVKIESTTSFTINSVYVYSSDVSVYYADGSSEPKLHLIYQEGTATNTYNEYLVYTIPQLDSDSDDIGVDKGDSILIKKSDPDSYIYVNGKRIEKFRFKNNLLPVVDEFYRLENLTTGDVPSESNRYLVIDEDGNLSFATSLSDEKLPLAELNVDFVEVTPSVTFEVSKDYRKLVDSHKSYRFAKYPIEIVPTKDSESQTPEIILSANTEPTTNIPYLPLKIRIENDNGKSKLVFEGSIGNNILTILDNGNVGIGTIPTYKLDVYQGSVRIWQGNGYAPIRIHSSGDGTHNNADIDIWSYGTGGTEYLYFDINNWAGNFYWRFGSGVGLWSAMKLTASPGGSSSTKGGGALSLFNNDTETIRISGSGNSFFNSGNVSIGTTLSGEGKLYVVTDNDIPAIKGTGCCYGVYGSSSGIGVYGSGNCTGVYGISYVYGVYGSSNCYGVYGFSNLAGVGVYGRSYYCIGTVGYSCCCIGVCGYGPVYGVYGNSDITGVFGFGCHTGVYGHGSNTGIYGYGNCFGVYGWSSCVGVYGCGSSVGVYGYSSNVGIVGCSSNIGVCGWSSNIGVYGYSCHCCGIGIVGNGGNIGVAGYSSNIGVRGCSNCIGVAGYSCCYTGVCGYGPVYGVYGYGSCCIGVYGCGPAYGLFGYSSSGIGVYGYGSNTGVCGCSSNIGVYGYSSSGIGVYGYGNCFGVCGRSNYCGVVGWGCAYDFYAAGPGTNYGPFTGAHDAIYSQGEFQSGDVVVVKDTCFKRRDGVSSVIPEISYTAVPCDKRVLGVYNVYLGCENCNHWVYKEGYTTQKFNWATVNALGEGLVKVKENEFGNIEIGDLLTTSDTPGFAMKQSDDIVHNYTLGKAAENVDWSTIPVDPEKGFKWTTIAVFYYAG